MGMANFNKNMFIGIGGLDAINLSHFIGAVYGMENMMVSFDLVCSNLVVHSQTDSPLHI